MPIVGSVVPDRPTTGKVSIPDDTYGGLVKDFFFFAEDDNGNKLKDAPPNKVRVYVELDQREVAHENGDPIVLTRKMNLSTYKNATFAKFLSAVTGIDVEAESALKAVDTDTLKNAPLRVLTKGKPNGFTDIEAFLAPRKAGSRVTVPAAPVPATFDDDDLPF